MTDDRSTECKDKGNASTSIRRLLLLLLLLPLLLRRVMSQRQQSRLRPCVCVSPTRPRADGALRILRLMRTSGKWKRQQHRSALVCRQWRWWKGDVYGGGGGGGGGWVVGIWGFGPEGRRKKKPREKSAGGMGGGGCDDGGTVVVVATGREERWR